MKKSRMWFYRPNAAKLFGADLEFSETNHLMSADFDLSFAELVSTIRGLGGKEVEDDELGLIWVPLHQIGMVQELGEDLSERMPVSFKERRS